MNTQKYLTVGSTTKGIDGIYSDGYRSGYRIPLIGDRDASVVHVCFNATTRNMWGEVMGPRALVAFSDRAAACEYAAYAARLDPRERVTMTLEMRLDERLIQAL